VITRRTDDTLAEIARETGGHYTAEFEARPDPASLLPTASDTGEADAVGDSASAALTWERALPLLALLLLLAEQGLAARLGRADLRRLARALRIAPPKSQRTAAALTALLATMTLGVAGSGWLGEGDAKLAEGDARAALALYRKTERTYGTRAESQLRIGNALYRLGEEERAGAHYLEVLRRLGRDRTRTRFAASFNLGNALLARGRFGEARDAFWSALLEQPDSVEAKYNYEWATGRLPPSADSDLPQLPSPPDSSDGSGPLSDEPQRVDGPAPQDPERGERSLTPEEADRWLHSLEERLDDPLRKQIGDELGVDGRGPGGMTW